jgi:hypothetical protein
MLTLNRVDEALNKVFALKLKAKQAASLSSNL